MPSPSATSTILLCQILLHPYVYAQQLPILEYAKENDIVIEAFSPLTYASLICDKQRIQHYIDL